MRRVVPSLVILFVAFPTTAQEPSEQVCGERIAEYLLTREALNTCETMNDCSQIWPGLCPHGPYFINLRADWNPVLSLAIEIGETCNIPECEPPRPLAAPSCVDGRCVPGRLAPTAGDFTSCWDLPLHYFEPGWISGFAQPSITSTTQREGLGVAQPGRIELELSWVDCEDCELHVNRTNPNMLAPLAEQEWVSEVIEDSAGRSRFTIEVPEAGVYYFAAVGLSGSYLMQATIVQADGGEPVVTHHGELVLRLCED